MRTERIYVMAHPDEERVFSQPREPSTSHAKALRADGYEIFYTDVTLPQTFGGSAKPVEATQLTEYSEDGNDEE